MAQGPDSLRYSRDPPRAIIAGRDPSPVALCARAVVPVGNITWCLFLSADRQPIASDRIETARDDKLAFPRHTPRHRFFVPSPGPHAGALFVVSFESC